MTIVYSTTFDATVDTNLNAYGTPSTNWYIVRVIDAADIKVIASRDRVEYLAGIQPDAGCGLVHSLIGSIDDYEVRALVRRATGRDAGMVGARSGGIGSSIFYLVGSDTNNDLVLYRANGGAAVAIKTTAASIPTNAEMVVTLKVSGTNPVLLEYSMNGVSDTHSDSAANRLQTGPPGVFIGRISALQEEVWVDNVQVSDKLTGEDFLPPAGGGTVGSGGANTGKRRTQEAMVPVAHPNKHLYRGLQGGGGDIDPFQWTQEEFEKEEPHQESHVEEHDERVYEVDGALSGDYPTISKEMLERSGSPREAALSRERSRGHPLLRPLDEAAIGRVLASSIDRAQKRLASEKLVIGYLSRPRRK